MYPKLAAALLALAGTDAAALPAERPATPQLETVIVEADDSFSDFAEWKAQIDAAIAKAKLKERAELTAHDGQQILVLKDDMPKLEAALDEMATMAPTRARRC